MTGMTGFWSEIRKGFADARAAQSSPRSPAPEAQEPPRQEQAPSWPPVEEPPPASKEGPEWTPVDDGPYCAECSRRSGDVAALQRELADANSVVANLVAEVESLTKKLKQKPEPKVADVDDLRRKLAECTSAISELTVENGRLEAKLKEKPGDPSRAGKGDEQYKKLKIAIAKWLHPDTAATNKPLAAALEKIFKELRAEIDRIDRL